MPKEINLSKNVQSLVSSLSGDTVLSNPHSTSPQEGKTNKSKNVAKSSNIKNSHSSVEQKDHLALIQNIKETKDIHERIKMYNKLYQDNFVLVED